MTVNVSAANEGKIDGGSDMDLSYALLIAVVVIVIILLAVVGSFTVTRSYSMCLARNKVEYMIDEDISNGRERHMLPAISYLRHDETPLDFHYVTDHVQCEPNIYVDVSLTNMTCCGCTDDCTSDNCACSKGIQCKRFYGSDGRLSADFKLETPEMIRECNMACKCNRKSCKNMVIQAGCQARLVLFRTKSRGWGVRTLENLARGTFIGIYSGELVSVISSQRREDDTYLFNLSNSHTIMNHNDSQGTNAVPDWKTEEEQPNDSTREEERIDMRQAGAGNPIVDESQHELTGETPQQQKTETDETKSSEAARSKTVDFGEHFVCDAKFYGNFTRFINHSCEPNVIGIRTFTSHQDQRFPHISFFTNQDIPAGTELTLNYGDSYWLVKCKRDKVYCLCRRSKCKFNKRTLPVTMKQQNDE